MHGSRDKWPKSVVEAFHLMVKTQDQLITIGARLQWSTQKRRGGRGGIQLIQQEESSGRGRGNGGRGRGGSGGYQRPTVPEGTVMVPGTDESTMAVQWYACKQWGHIAPNCPRAQSSSFLMQRMQFSQADCHTGIERL